MSAHRTNNFPPAEPKSLEQLTRPQIATRVAVVRECIDMMVTQAQMDSGLAFECLGACKVVLFHLGRQLRAMATPERDQLLEGSNLIQQDAKEPAEPQRTGPFAPTEKQVAFYQRLAESPVFSEDERRWALDWLATRATRQTIKDQIDWLKLQVETRQPLGAR